MSLETALWLATATYAIHILEEYTLDWRNWARNVLALPAEWNDFYLTNAVVIVLGIVAAEIAPSCPAIALAFPALMLINATFFHVAPFIIKRGRFSPGLITAVLLFYPVAILCYQQHALESTLTIATILISFFIGAMLMAAPIILLRMKNKSYFRQDHSN